MLVCAPLYREQTRIVQDYPQTIVEYDELQWCWLTDSKIHWLQHRTVWEIDHTVIQIGPPSTLWQSEP